MKIAPNFTVLTLAAIASVSGCATTATDAPVASNFRSDESMRDQRSLDPLALVVQLRNTPGSSRVSLLESNLADEPAAGRSTSGANTSFGRLAMNQSGTIAASFLKGRIGGEETLRRVELDFPSSEKGGECTSFDDAAERLDLSIQPPMPTGYGGTQWRREAVARTALDDVYVSTNDVQTPCVISVVVDFKD